MSVGSTTERVDRLATLDVCVAGPSQVAGGLTDIRIVRGWLDAREADLARRQAELSDTDGAAPAADVLGRAGRTTRRRAEQVAARATALADAPSLSDGLANGTISADHADAFASVTGKADDSIRLGLLEEEAEIAADAIGRTPEQFRRRLKERVRILADDDGVERSEQQRDEARIHFGIDESSGMGEVRGELHPDDYQKVKRRIDAEVAALQRGDRYRHVRREQLQAIALVSLITGQKATARTPAEVVIHVALESINGTPGAPKFGEYVDGSPVPVESIRRHACDANIIPVVLNGDGMPLDVGRARRLATKDQRHALRSMHRTCAVGECNTAFDRCEIHHSLEWTAHQGPTDLKYLFPVCAHHHHRLHEGRWRAQLDPSTRELTVTYPDGTLHSRSRPDLLDEAPTRSRNRPATAA